VAQKRAPIDVDQLRNWKLVEAFRARVLPLLERRVVSSTEEDPRRTLQPLDYFCAYLLAMFNPLITSLRSLAALSHCQRMRQVTQASFTASSFSACQHLFDPEILSQTVRQLAQKVQAKGLGQEGDPRVRQALRTLTAVDGTVWRGVNRMLWAPAAGYGRAVRLHLQFSVFDQTPQQWTITPANRSERQVFSQHLQRGAFYVADRLYGGRHDFLETVRQAGADFVFRLNNNTIMEPVQEARPLSAADQEAVVIWDRKMRLGVHGKGPVVRVVRVEAKGDVFHLATSREDLAAQLIGLIYRQRWQIELFFKWIKMILNGRHWLAESAQGVEMQLYCVLICALLLMLWTGQRPNKRMVEALRFYLMGWANEEDLALLLRRAQPRQKS
jgi:hypothetical protein